MQDWNERSYAEEPKRREDGSTLNWYAADRWKREQQWLSTDRSEKLLHWPSFDWHWQQAALVGAVVAGLALIATGLGIMFECHHHLHSGGLETAAFGFALAGIALYGGWTTGWHSKTAEAPLAGKVAAQVAIFITALVVVTAVVAIIAVITAPLWVPYVALKGALEGGC